MSTKKIKYGLKEYRKDLEKEFQNITFGELLGQYRAGEGISQQEVADIIGTRRARVCHLEKGRKIPSAKIAYDIAVILGMNELLCVQLALQDQLREQKLNLKVFIAA